MAKFMGQPNIAGVTDYFDENGTSYFVMDYIEGISFKTYIANQGGKVSPEEALDVLIPVLRALTAVHAEGFIHRDVTPDNIYITKDGNVKLLDFGSARYSLGDKSKSLDVVLKVGYAPRSSTPEGDDRALTPMCIPALPVCTRPSPGICPRNLWNGSITMNWYPLPRWEWRFPCIWSGPS